MALTTFLRLFVCVYGGWVGGRGEGGCVINYQMNFKYQNMALTTISVCLSVLMGVGWGGGLWRYQLQGPKKMLF
jgi:hypothetical protein